MKSIRKDLLIEQELINETILEKNIMLNANHPFIAKMDYWFMSDLKI